MGEVILNTRGSGSTVCAAEETRWLKNGTKINVLGTEYSVYERSEEKDKALKNCAGYCDKTSKTIVIGERDNGCDLDCFDMYQKKVLRHEIIHAFLFESGLWECWEHENCGHDETFIDWFAVQSPKIHKVFEELGCL